MNHFDTRRSHQFFHYHIILNCFVYIIQAGPTARLLQLQGVNYETRSLQIALPRFYHGLFDINGQIINVFDALSSGDPSIPASKTTNDCLATEMVTSSLLRLVASSGMHPMGAIILCFIVLCTSTTRCRY
jgi:hypothetical protein